MRLTAALRSQVTTVTLPSGNGDQNRVLAVHLTIGKSYCLSLNLEIFSPINGTAIALWSIVRRYQSKISA
jgi:hypothetical protein